MQKGKLMFDLADPRKCLLVRGRMGCGRPGWSLKELLVALVVFFVLVALAVVIGQEMRQRAWSARSETNIRLLAQVNLRYAADHGGSFCPAQDAAGLIRWHGGRTSPREKFDPTKGFLYPYLKDGGESLVCPVFQQYPQSGDSFEAGAGDYGYNEMYIGGTPQNPFIPEKISNVANPVRTIMFTDTCLPRSNGIQEYPFCEPYQAVNRDGSLGAAMTPTMHFRHGGLAHVAWCDGSVTAEPPTQLGGVNLYGGDAGQCHVGWIGPAQNNGWWNSKQKASTSDPAK